MFKTNLLTVLKKLREYKKSLSDSLFHTINGDDFI